MRARRSAAHRAHCYLVPTGLVLPRGQLPRAALVVGCDVRRARRRVTGLSDALLPEQIVAVGSVGVLSCPDHFGRPGSPPGRALAADRFGSARPGDRPALLAGIDA